MGHKMLKRLIFLKISAGALAVGKGIFCQRIQYFTIFFVRRTERRKIFSFWESSAHGEFASPSWWSRKRSAMVCNRSGGGLSPSLLMFMGFKFNNSTPLQSNLTRCPEGVPRAKRSLPQLLSLSM